MKLPDGPEWVWQMSGEWMSTREVSKLLGVSTRTLKRWRQFGVGPKYARIGARCKYSKEALIEFLDRALRGEAQGVGPFRKTEKGGGS